MTKAMIELTLRVANSIGEVAAAAWDACANPPSLDPRQRRGCACAELPDAQDANLTSHIQPFHFTRLPALRWKLSQSVRARTGWQPHAPLAEDADGELLGAVPCYVKSHSRGEYVFDHGWAEAYERAGGSYYPKLQVSVPFTPATGRRLLARPGPHAEAVRAHSPMRSSISAGAPAPPPCTSPSRPRPNGTLGRARLPQAHPPAVPLGERRLCQLR